MMFIETRLKGAFILEVDRREDNRGFFARAFCQREFVDHDLKPLIAQANIAFNRKKGTVRGMHFQYPPAAETKLVRCTRGAILDIIVDLRPESPTYLDYIAVELTADNQRALYVPERFAHGYQTLEDQTETSYQVGEFYAPDSEGGLLYSDPRLQLEWPLPVDPDFAERRRMETPRRDRAGVKAQDEHLRTGSRSSPWGNPLPALSKSLSQEDVMIIVDNALKAREQQGKPIRVGMIGAGFMGQGLTNQIMNSVPGMRMAAIYNRQPERAVGVYQYAGCENVAVIDTQARLDDAIRQGVPAVAEDALALCRSSEIDVLIDVTGSVEFGAHVLLEAFEHGKSVVLMNAEVDATIGPILQVYARKHGVMLSACEGDEPGVQMNLYRWVTGSGLIPRVIGNVKGLQDPYRNPTTQKGWAERWGQNAAMVTSFADGSKISFEQSIVANATGFKVQSRGMSRGLTYDGSIMDIQKLYNLDEVRALGGIVDYTVGPAGVKVFCLAEHTDPKQRHYLNLYKMGEGPLYPFWIPYHLVHFEAPNAIARMVLFGDNVAPPLGWACG